MPKVSVLIPVYNVEKYLHECLDSVINQTFSDIEIICINDGATDNSPKILDEYAQKDPRIQVIHKSNEGYGKSLNRGIQKATGEYILIVEPDDFADLNMIESLYTLAAKEKADVLKSNFYEYQTSSNKSKEKIGILNDEIISNPTNTQILSVLKYGPTVWTGLYKRSFLLENNIEFSNTPGASYQDLGFNFKTIAMAQKIVLTNKPFYHYRTDNEGSSVKNPNKIFCVCDEFNEVERYLKEKNKFEQIKHILPNAKYANYMWNYKRLPHNGKLKFLQIFAKEFATYQKEGLLSPETLGKRKYKRILKLIQNPKLFNFLYIIEHLPHDFAHFVARIKGA